MSRYRVVGVVLRNSKIAGICWENKQESKPQSLTDRVPLTRLLEEMVQDIGFVSLGQEKTLHQYRVAESQIAEYLYCFLCLNRLQTLTQRQVLSV